MHRFGQLPAIGGADCTRGATVIGNGQDNGDVVVGIRLDFDLPPDVMRPFQPACIDQRAPGDREGVIPQGPVAEFGSWKSSLNRQLEGELGLTVVGGRRISERGGRELRSSSRPVRVVPDPPWNLLVDPPTRMVIFPVSASKDTSLLTFDNASAQK